MSRLAIIVPAYNEEEIIKDSIFKLRKYLKGLIGENLVSSDSFILVVDDGSSDNTFKILKGIKSKYLKIVKLSRNYGHQFALYAGLMETLNLDIDITVSIDADLQDDINVIRDMVVSYNLGNEIVYGVRNNRDTDSFFKRNSALLFYKLMSFFGADIIYNHADYRLMSRKVLKELGKFNEYNLFLRGIIPMIGFNSDIVYYRRLERSKGKSKYNLKKMISLAIDGVTSLSVKPIRIIISIGFICSFFSFLYLLYIIYGYVNNNNLVSGWTTIVLLISFFGSFQILCIGIIGEYISKIYLETKKRPKYVIEKRLFDNKK